MEFNAEIGESVAFELCPDSRGYGPLGMTLNKDGVAVTCGSGEDQTYIAFHPTSDEEAEAFARWFQAAADRLRIVAKEIGAGDI